MTLASGSASGEVSTIHAESVTIPAQTCPVVHSALRKSRATRILTSLLSRAFARRHLLAGGERMRNDRGIN